MYDLELDILYRFEHELLPRLFYFGKEGFIRKIRKTDGLYQLFDGLCRREKKDNPYQKNEFRTAFKEVEGLMVFVLHMPKKEHPNYCRRVLLILEPDCSKMAFYTVEEGESAPWLGRWDCEVKYHYTPVADYLKDEETDGLIKALNHFRKGILYYE